MWLCSVIRSCATQDDVNKDNVCKPTVSPGINRPPHPDHLACTLCFGTTKQITRRVYFLEPWCVFDYPVRINCFVVIPECEQALPWTTPARTTSMLVKQVNKFDGKRAGDFLEWQAKLCPALSLYNRPISPSFKGYNGRGAKMPTVLLRKASEARVNRRLRRYYLIVLLLPNIFTLACLLLSSI